MVRENLEKQEFYSWIIEDSDTVTKKIDVTLLKYGESGIPQEIIGFFVNEDLKIGEYTELTLRYKGEKYKGLVKCIKPHGQMKIYLDKILFQKLLTDELYKNNARLQFSNIDTGEYELIVLPEECDEKILDDESDLYQLRYNGEGPIFKAVKVTKKDFSVFELLRKYKKGKLILNVDFQRREVWKRKQKCELIESVLMGLPLPVFYFKQLEDADYVVVDGKQRLTALFEYLDDKFSLRGLKILEQLNGKKFSQLTDDLAIYQTQLEDYQVYSHVILPPTPDKILFDIFDRVNRGGTQLNKMEIRNALYHGKGLNMLIAVTETEAFRRATSIDYKKDFRMKGVYLMTRSASYNLYFSHKLEKNKKPYQLTADTDDLQGVALTYLNNLSEEELEQYEQKIVFDLKRIYDILGPNAFRKEFDSSKPINMNMFETLMYFMMIIRDRKLRFDNETLKEKILDAVRDDQYASNIGNRQDSIEKIMARFSAMNDLAERICI